MRASLRISLLFTLIPATTLADPVPATAPTSPYSRFIYVLYPLAPPKVDLGAQLREALARDFPAVRPLDQPTDAGPPTDHIRCAPIAVNVIKHPAPDEQTLRHFGRGLDADHLNRLRNCPTALAIAFDAPAALAPSAVTQSNRLILSLARANDALVWDDTTREMFSPDSFETLRVHPLRDGRLHVPSQVTLHAYRRDDRRGLIREVTLGMQKFACPDVVVDDVTGTAASSMASLVNLLCQHMAESGPPTNPAETVRLDLSAIRNDEVRQGLEASLRDGATRRADVATAPAEPDQGDPDNRLLALTFATAPGATPQERQSRTLATLFGTTDTVARVRADDVELTAARDRARAKLPAKADQFRQGLPVGERLLIKSPFRSTDGRTEYMWVEVLSWQGDRITGILTSRPAFPSDLNPGSRVTVEQSEAFDYLHVHRDGTAEGNETGTILGRRQN
jgi:uncharacterized protein YegJ (DUF2314 family)